MRFSARFPRRGALGTRQRRSRRLSRRRPPRVPLVVRSKTTRDARDRPSRPVRSSRSVLPFGPPRAPDPRVADDVFPFSSSRREQQIERARFRLATRADFRSDAFDLNELVCVAELLVAAVERGAPPEQCLRPAAGMFLRERQNRVECLERLLREKQRLAERRVSRRRHTAGARRRDVRARHLNRRERRPHDRPPVRDPRVPVPGRARGGGGAGDRRVRRADAGRRRGYARRRRGATAGRRGERRGRFRF